MSPVPLSYRLVIAGTAGLLVALPWWLAANVEAFGPAVTVPLGALVPLALLWLCIQRRRNWSGITALFMIPLATIGIMDIVATLRVFDSGFVIALLSVTVFFAALDAGRRVSDA